MPRVAVPRCRNSECRDVAMPGSQQSDPRGLTKRPEPQRRRRRDSGGTLAETGVAPWRIRYGQRAVRGSWRARDSVMPGSIVRFPMWETPPYRHEIWYSCGAGTTSTSISRPRCGPPAEHEAPEQRPNSPPHHIDAASPSPRIMDRWRKTECAEDTCYATSSRHPHPWTCGRLIAWSEPWHSNLGGCLPEGASTPTHRSSRVLALRRS